MEDRYPKDESRYNAAELIQYADWLLRKGGLSEQKASRVAETLVEGDLMGHRTHGLALLTAYLKELETGQMTTDGEPEVLQDRGSAMAWDGRYLPGPWLVHRAIDQALERMNDHPVVTVTIGQSHHIGALATYPERATEHGFLMWLSCSDPVNETVAPFGGLGGVYSPNPIAAGIPTEGDPILFDISLSATANGVVHQHKQERKTLPHPWLLDPEGRPTDDPDTFFEQPPSTILPLGGLDTGYKGFALGLFVEALANGLSGFGRQSEPGRWGSTVFIQLIDPEAFGGKTYLQREMSRFREVCLASPLPPGEPQVRLPGSRALALRRKYKKEGIPFSASLVSMLEAYALKNSISMPDPL